MFLISAASWGCNKGNGVVNKTVLNTSMALVMVAAGLAGCSRGPLYQGSGGGAAAAVVGGKVADGYVANSTVTLDLNDDRVCSAAEPKTVSDSNGDFKFTAGNNGVPSSLTEAQIKSHMVCSRGGVDLASGAPVVGELLAPPGSTVITPLTSLVMSKINAANPPVEGSPSPVTAATVSTASSNVATSLGIVGTDLLNSDPVDLAASNPALLQKTGAIGALLAQTAAIVGAAASGGNDALVTDAVKDALFAKALASITQVLATTPLSTANMGTIANNLLSSTTTAAKTDAALTTALPTISTIKPDAVAAFAAPALTSMATAVVNSPVANLAAPSSTNPLSVVANNESLANAVGALATTLLTTTSTLTPAQLTTIASGALSGSSTSGSVTVLTPAQIQAAITAVDNTITLPASVATDLGNANLLNNVVRVAAVGVNCPTAVVDGSCQPLATLADNQPYQASATVAKIDSISLKLGTVTGNPIVGTGGLNVSILPVAAGDNRKLSLSLSNITLTKNLAGDFISVAIPSSATLVVNGDTGTKQATATLAGSAISSLVTSDETNKTIKLNVAALQTALGAQNKSFNVLASLLNGSKSTGETFRFQTAIEGLSLSIGPTTTPLRTSVYTVDLKFQ